MFRPFTLCKSKTVNILQHACFGLERSETALKLSMVAVLRRSVVPKDSVPLHLSG
ncbi:hypothetical protein SATMO3_08660 [Sporomusa aerivorans]